MAAEINAKALLPKRVEPFRRWLAISGAQVVPTTNEYEVVRFIAGFDTGVIYTNKGRTRLGFQGVGREALEAFLSGQPWRAAPVGRRPKRSKPKVAAIRHRDGPLCFFCRREVAQADETVEHLVSVSHGGPTHLSNLFLAHRVCNEQAGNLSAVEKIRRHIEAEIARRGVRHPVTEKETEPCPAT